MRTGAQQKFNLISSEHIIGGTVCDRAGKEIGEIDRLMIDKTTGQARYAIVDFCGFMCLRPGHHAVPWSALEYDEHNDRYVASVTEKQLEAAPEFDDSSWTDREWEIRLHEHFHARPYWEASAAR
jgi:hypothetical protein